MTLAEDLAMTVEVCGSAAMSAPAARLFVAELAPYPEPAVHAALARCRKEVFGRLALAHVIERIDDARPGPEEAWAMVPKDEYESAALTSEMAEALAIAAPLIRSGDLVQARMAFTEPYRKLIGQARAERKPVEWRVSLGWDVAGRQAALADAMAAGRIALEDARVLGLEHHATVPLLEGPTSAGATVGELAHDLVARIKNRAKIEGAQRRDAAMDAATEAHARGERCATGCDRCMPTGVRP